MTSSQVGHHVRRVSRRITRYRSRRGRDRGKRRRVTFALRGTLVDRMAGTVRIRSNFKGRNATRRYTGVLAGMDSSEGRKIARGIAVRSQPIIRTFNAYNTRVIGHSVKEGLQAARSSSVYRERESGRRY